MKRGCRKRGRAKKAVLVERLKKLLSSEGPLSVRQLAEKLEKSMVRTRRVLKSCPLFERDGKVWRLKSPLIAGQSPNLRTASETLLILREGEVTWVQIRRLSLDELLRERSDLGTVLELTATYGDTDIKL